jgi:hypothetical protein
VLRAATRGAWTAMAVILAATAVIAGGLASAAGAAALPDGRAYEMVSPPDKNGGDVVPDTQRTRSAADGGAVSFTSLAGFAGNLGTGISSDYVSVRSTSATPGTNGWATHGAMPRMRALSAPALFAQVSPLYVGEFSADLNRGVVTTWGAIDGNANVDGVSNLYRNTALRSTGAGPYDLVSPCPLCDSASTPLPDYPSGPLGINLRPILADASPDLDHVAFESLEPLTADTPAQPCDMSAPDISCHVHVYQWDDGTLRLAGRVPALPATECDDVAGPACVPADVSLAGQGTGASRSASNDRTPHVVSDGSDGHVRLFFTQPTDASGSTSDDLGNSTDVNQAFSGRIFMRVDGTATVQLNASERTSADSYAPAQLLDASVDGTRVFFMTRQALTNDAPADGGNKLYMYDTSKPATAPDNLTFLSAGAGGDVRATIGVSSDGRYVYFATRSSQIYVWHDGTLTLVGPSPTSLGSLNENLFASVNWGVTLHQARVTPSGRHLLFTTTQGAGLLGYDHGSCTSDLGPGCRELYVYSADTGNLACASCNPSGAAATAMATDAVWEHAGAAPTSFHLNHAISDDGSRIFFTTAEALVPEDVNRRQDAYEWTAAGTHGCESANALTKGCITLLSTGASTSDSYFLDASPSGSDAFFITREQLVGWDRDQAYDLYDARVNGGFPDPVTPPDCSADACQGAPGTPPAAGPIATSLFDGAGNLLQKLKPHTARKRCKRGFVRKRVRGKVRCVKKRHHRARKTGRSSTRGAK